MWKGRRPGGVNFSFIYFTTIGGYFPLRPIQYESESANAHQIRSCICHEWFRCCIFPLSLSLQTCQARRLEVSLLNIYPWLQLDEVYWMLPLPSLAAGGAYLVHTGRGVSSSAEDKCHSKSKSVDWKVVPARTSSSSGSCNNPIFNPSGTAILPFTLPNPVMEDQPSKMAIPMTGGRASASS